MGGYILRRMLSTIPVMAIVAVFVFLMLRLTPGDPAAIIAGDYASPEQIAGIRERLGLDRADLHAVLHLDRRACYGAISARAFSSRSRWPSSSPTALEPTLVAVALDDHVSSLLVAVPLGVLAAYNQGTWIDRFVMGFSVLGFSVPVFVIGYVLIYIFAIELAWLPVQGYQRIATASAAGCCG